MNFDEIELIFDTSVSDRIPNMECHSDLLMWLASGLSVESSEVEDIVRKNKFMNDRTSTPDVVITAIKDELGDVLWYVYAICEKLGISISQVMLYNMSKLNSRMPDGHFSKEEHWNRFIKKLEEKYNEQK